MRIDMTDRVAIVTGAAHRVGRAIVLELARSGVHILVHSFNAPDDVVKATLRDVKSEGVEAYSVKADIRQPQGIDAIFEALEAHFSRLDILVNSASNFQRRMLLDVTLDDWRETMDTNLTAPFLLTQRAIPLMRANTPASGVIINICDRGAVDPWVEFAHHGISKAGLLALTKVTAAGYGPDIRANAIIPGLVLKPDGMAEARWQGLAQHVPAGRPGTAEDVGRAVVYLASEDYLTGVVLNVDGGDSLV